MSQGTDKERAGFIATGRNRIRIDWKEIRRRVDSEAEEKYGALIRGAGFPRSVRLWISRWRFVRRRMREEVNKLAPPDAFY